MLTTLNVLLLSGDKNEACELEETLDGFATLVCAHNLAELASLLEKMDCDVVLYGWPFYEYLWHGAMQKTRDQYPDLPMIVLSAAGATQEWRGVLDAGAFDLLALPALEHARVSHDARRMQRAAAAEPAAMHAS